MDNDSRTTKTIIRQALIRFKKSCWNKLLKLAQDDRLRLKHFSLASLVFFTSYGMIFHANKNLEPSLQQEFTALFALIGCIVSLLWAISLQILYILKNTGMLQR